MNVIRFVLSLVFLLPWSFGSCLAGQQAEIASAEVAPTTNELTRDRLLAIDRKIILEGIALARFTTYFRRAANEHWWLRGWLYPIAQEAGTACSLANGVVDLSARADAWNNPSRISVTATRRGLASNITGNILGGSSSALELGQNGLVVLKAHRRGFSPGDSIATVKLHLKTMDDLLAERNQVIASTMLSEDERKIRAIEASVMERIRDQLAYEFRERSAYSRQFMYRENTFYTLDSMQNFGQLAASVLAVRSFHEARLNGPSGITALVANSVETLNPALSALAGYAIRRHQRARLAKEIPYRYRDPTIRPAEEWSEAQELIANSPDATVVKETAIFVNNSARVEHSLESEIKKTNKKRRVARQQLIAGPLIGLANVAQDLSATIAYYGYRGAPVTANRLNLAGRISRTTGQGYSMITTASARIQKTIYDRRLEKQGLLPEQIYRQRLVSLDKLESQVRAAMLP